MGGKKGKIRRTRNSEWVSGNEYTRPDSCASDLKLVHNERGETPFLSLRRANIIYRRSERSILAFVDFIENFIISFALRY